MDTQDKATLTWKVRDALRNEDFDLFGIAQAKDCYEESNHIREWISAGRNGTMHFLERNSDKRADIETLVPGARSVIVAGLQYFGDEAPDDTDDFFVSRYARVRDYHEVMKMKLQRVAAIINKEVQGTRCRVFCDSAPLTEKAWAVRAGLGWRGRNSLIINENIGSFFFLGEIVTTAELVHDDHEVHDQCGTCRRCIEACPTKAICDDRSIDARRCISYLTVEHAGELAEEFRGKMGKMIFGCDRCQEVCPWNKNASHYLTAELNPLHPVTSLTKNDWLAMTSEQFKTYFRSSPISRTGYQKIRQNIKFVADSSPE